MGSSEFLIETLDFCFLCLQQAPPKETSTTEEPPPPSPASNSSTSTNNLEMTSFKKICQHLQTDLDLVFKETMNHVPKQINQLNFFASRDLRGRFCTDCAKLVNQFTKLWVEFEKIQTQVNSTLTNVYGKLVGGENNSQLLDQFQKEMFNNPLSLFHFAFVERLRNDTWDKCATILGKERPPPSMRSVSPEKQHKIKCKKKNDPTKVKIKRSPSLDSDYSEDEVVVVKREKPPPPPIISLVEDVDSKASLTKIESKVINNGRYQIKPSASATASFLQDLFNDGSTNNNLVSQRSLNECILEIILDDDDDIISLPDETISHSATNTTSTTVSSTNSILQNSKPNSSLAVTSSRTNYELQQRRFPCLQCNRRFKLSFALKQHRKRFHTGFAYRCKMCPGAFKTEQGLKVHITMMHVKREPMEIELGSRQKNRSRPVVLDKTRCDVCYKKFAKREYMVQHRNSHFGRNFHCKMCGRSFSHSSNLYAHMKKFHPSQKKTASTRIQKRSAVTRLNATTTTTSYQHSTSTPVVSHVIKEELVDPLSEDNTETFIFPVGERVNGYHHHHRNERVSNVEVTVVGNNDTTTVPTTTNRNSNVMMITHRCIRCRRSFKTQASLRRHVTMVHTSRPTVKVNKRAASKKYHRCEICDKTFNRPSKLRIHKETKHFL